MLHAYGGCDISQIDQLLATFQRKAERVIYLSDGRSLAHEDNIKDAPIWLADERADMPTLKRSEVIFGAIETKSIMRWIALAQLFDRLTRTRAKSYHLFLSCYPSLPALSLSTG